MNESVPTCVHIFMVLAVTSLFKILFAEERTDNSMILNVKYVTEGGINIKKLLII